ncbi:MAG: 50S ribosomal protein L10 [Eubacteriales bacterium]|nr:50S ribosomal protein L10 [Eubacteriales bacterium]
MSTNLELKKQEVQEIKQLFDNAESVVVVNYTGITVEEITALRVKFREAGVNYKVLKNTLVKRAVEDLNLPEFEAHLEGPSAFAFGDAVGPAKVIAEFLKNKENAGKMEVKGGIVEGRYIDAKGVEALSKLPSREELIAKMLGSMNAPVSNLVGVLSATLRSVLYALNAVKDQKENNAA